MAATLDKNNGGQPQIPTFVGPTFGSPMTLRDYFAAAALAVLATESARQSLLPDIAKTAYEVADAMLKERAK